MTLEAKGISQSQLDLKIYPATSKDFDSLTDICRLCFPEQLRWKAPKSRNRKWWEFLLNSQNCEIWAGSIQGQVIAFVTLVFDRIKYEDAWENHHLTFRDVLYISLTSTKQSIKRFCTKLKQRRIRKQQKSLESSKDAQLLPTYARIEKIFAENTPWCGPYAVINAMQNKGVATKLIYLCFERARYHGFAEMYACLKRKNFKSKNLLEKIGFVKFDEIDYAFFYKKSLNKWEI